MKAKSFLKSVMIVGLIFSLFILPTLFMQPIPSTTLAKQEPQIESKKTYSPSTLNYTWAEAWNGQENSPLPDYNSVPYRNVVKNPSFEVGLTDWITYTFGAASYCDVQSDDVWYGSLATDLGVAAVAGVEAHIQQYTPLTVTPASTLMFAMEQTAVPDLDEISILEFYIRSVAGATYFISYSIDGGAALVNKIQLGTAANTFYYAVRNITADALFLGLATPMYVVCIYCRTLGNGVANYGHFDSIALLQDQIQFQGSNPWYNNEFEHPVLAGGADPGDWPFGWSNEGHIGLAAEINTYFDWANPYLHRWCLRNDLTAVANNHKYTYYTLGVNPPAYLSFAIKMLVGSAVGASQSLIHVYIYDTTADLQLIYSFGPNAASGLTDNATRHFIYEQIATATWYYRIKAWITDWTAAYGVAPNMAHAWGIYIRTFNHGAAVATNAAFDAIWMGNTLPPKYNCFLFGDFRNVAYSANFNGETTGWLDEYGFDFDGLFVADDIGAAASRFAQVTCMIQSQPYSTRHITLGLGNSKILAWTDGAGVERLSIAAYGQTAAAWVGGTTEGTTNIWSTGQMHYALGSTMTFHFTSTTTSYVLIYIHEVTGAGGAIDSRIVIRWMAIEVENPDSDVSLSYSSLDGWGVPYDFVQTFCNNSREVNAEFTVAHAVTDVVNISVFDFYNNPLLSRFYTINLTVQPINIRLNLVSTTLQSYGLTRADIYGNVTFSELFNAAALDPALWDDVTVGTLSLVGGRVREATLVPGDLVYLYTLDTYPTSSTLVVYATVSVLGDNYGIDVGGRNAVFPAGNDWWSVMTDPGGGEWTLMSRQGGLYAARDVGGVVVANTWYKIVVTMTWNHVWVTVYNPDETINALLDTFYDNQPATWSYYLENAANAVPTVTLYDLFIIQGNTGYGKTLPFYDSGNTLLMPDDYVFNGTANNGAIRFQIASTITLTQNRLIQLVAPVILNINYFDLDGWGVDYDLVRTYINGSRLNAKTFTNTSAIWHYFNILVTDFYGSTVYSNLAYPVTQTPLSVDIQLQLVRVRIVSATGTGNDVWIDQIGSGVAPKNMSFYGSGETQLYATALGVTYRVTGWLNSTTFTPLGYSTNKLVWLDSGNVLITLRQNRIITLITDKTLQDILDAISVIPGQGPTAGGGMTITDYQNTMGIRDWIILGIVGLSIILTVGTLLISKAREIEARNKATKAEQKKNDKDARVRKALAGFT